MKKFMLFMMFMALSVPCFADNPLSRYQIVETQNSFPTVLDTWTGQYCYFSPLSNDPSKGKFICRDPFEWQSNAIKTKIPKDWSE